MSDIICPQCGAAIPADSKYCDQCGVELLECVACGTLGTDNFCPECGKPMVARRLKGETSAPRPPETVKVNPPAPGASTTAAPDKTMGRARGGRLFLRERKTGLELELIDDAIIGRTEGVYSRRLHDYQLISRRHGAIKRSGRDWVIEDFSSTNGTYVNDVEVTPGRQMPIKAGDVVDIGTYIFDVVEL